MVCSLHLFLACPETEASAERAAPVQPRDTTSHKTDEEQGPAAQHRNSTQQAGVAKEPRKEETCVYLPDSLRCKPEANTAL